MNRSDRPCSPSPATPSGHGISISGSVLPRPESPNGATRRVTGVWFGSAAVHPGAMLAGQYGELRMETDGTYRYRTTLDMSGLAAGIGGSGSIEEAFTLNLSDSAGSSCVARLTVALQASACGLELVPSFSVESTVTERYCLTAQNGLALLCMETGEHFEMCRLDTPLSAVARSHNREFFGVGGQHLLRIDPINGNTIWIGILAQPRRIVALDAAPDGLLYGIDVQGDLYRVQPGNGSTTLLVRLGLPSLSRGAVAHVDNHLLWTAADNRLHDYDLNTGEHTTALAALQPMAPVTLHERVLAMMPAMDGGLFMATAEGVVRIDPATGGWRDTGLKGRLHELMGTSAPSGPVWGGREPGQPVANDYPSDWGSCWPVLQPH